MINVHGFFIPDSEYIIDLKEFVKYLDMKIGVGNVCLYCNREFSSIYSVQQHMRDMSHCKIFYDDEEEYEDFYDFSKDYINQHNLSYQPNITLSDV